MDGTQKKPWFSPATARSIQLCSVPALGTAGLLRNLALISNWPVPPGLLFGIGKMDRQTDDHSQAFKLLLPQSGEFQETVPHLGPA